MDLTKTMSDMFETVSNVCLSAPVEYREYSDRDLLNVSTIFMEVFMAKMYKEHKDKISQKGLEELSAEAGKSLRQSILLFTGKDMHTIVKNI